MNRLFKKLRNWFYGTPEEVVTLPVTPPNIVTWKERPNGPYGYVQAVADFKNVWFWGDASRSNVRNEQLEITLLKNLLGGEGGHISRIRVTPALGYQIEFDMLFDYNIDLGKGGKVGFGFLIGKGYTGGQPAHDGNGGSARLMWQTNGAGWGYLKPYLYHKDQPDTWGQDFGKSHIFIKGEWLRVKMIVKSNSGSNTDGRIFISINNAILIDQLIRWTTNDVERHINSICFETFRGGGEKEWMVATDGHIYFNNVKWAIV